MKLQLSTDDCVEIYCALSNEELQEKIGEDGELLASGDVELEPAEIAECRYAVASKLGAIHLASMAGMD